MDENVIQVNGGIMINVDVTVKNVLYAKKINFGILLYVIVRMEHISQVLWIIICDEVIKSYDEKIKTVPTNFNEKYVTCKTHFFKFYLHIF